MKYNGQSPEFLPFYFVEIDWGVRFNNPIYMPWMNFKTREQNMEWFYLTRELDRGTVQNHNFVLVPIIPL